MFLNCRLNSKFNESFTIVYEYEHVKPTRKQVEFYIIHKLQTYIRSMLEMDCNSK